MPKRWRSGVLKRGAGQVRFARFLAHASLHGEHPNALRRKRSQKAGQLVAALHVPATQSAERGNAVAIFGLLLCRYHNTAEAFDDFTPLLVRFQQHQDVNVLRRELLHQYATRGRAFYFTGLGGRKKDGRRGQPQYSPRLQAALGAKAPPLWACVLQSLPQWWRPNVPRPC